MRSGGTGIALAARIEEDAQGGSQTDGDAYGEHCKDHHRYRRCPVLVKGDRIEIRGFGSFALNYRPPRTGRNPKSGDKVQVPEKYVPHFKAGKELRERVDYGTEG